MVTRAILMLGMAIMAAGCAQKQDPIVKTQQVKMPVATMPEAPQSLKSAPNMPPLPVFVDKSNSKASACLTPKGVARLKSLLDLQDRRRRAWREWYMTNKD